MPHIKAVSMPTFQSASTTMPDMGIIHPDMARRSAYGHGKHPHARTEGHLEHLPEKHHKERKHRSRRGEHHAEEAGIRRVDEREHRGHDEFISAHGARAAHHGQAPSATTLTGMMGIIEKPSEGRDHNLGIPGILSSTSLGPHERQRIVSGIIENTMSRDAHEEGPVHAVTGHDSTAYNAGMVHIPGSRFR